MKRDELDDELDAELGEELAKEVERLRRNASKQYCVKCDKLKFIHDFEPDVNTGHATDWCKECVSAWFRWAFNREQEFEE